MRTSAVAIILAVSAIINTMRNSNIRAVEFFSILACGMAIGVFIVNLVMFLNMKRGDSQKA